MNFPKTLINKSKLERTGVIDIGSNTVRLVIFEGPSRSPRYFYNEKVNCGLGIGLRQTDHLHPKGVQKAIKTLQRFVFIANGLKLSNLFFLATAAVRNAIDGPQFVRNLEKKFSINIRVLSGREEGALAAHGVLMSWPMATGIVCDIGGGSLELAHLEGGKIKITQSFRIGPLALNHLPDCGRSKIDFILEELCEMDLTFPNSVNNFFLVGGSWRALARIHMNKVGHPLKVLQGYKISVQSLRGTLAHVIETKVPNLSKLTSTSSERLQLLPNASKILSVLFRRFRPNQVIFSGYGIREGFIHSNLSLEIKKRDPLLEACKILEKDRSRIPGFGEVLFKWISPIFPKMNKQDKRLYKAACYLHDTIWQAHPDYRSEICFETVTGANLGGIDHQGRVFLALAMMSRYKKTDLSKVDKEFLNLLDAKEVKMAMILGASMRLGSMLSVTTTSYLERTRLFLKENYICLSVAAKDNFIGEAVEKRLGHLGYLMGLESKIFVE